MNKKIIALVIFLVLVSPFSFPKFSFAATNDSVTQIPTVNTTQLQALLSLMLQELAMLESEYAQLIANQNTVSTPMVASATQVEVATTTTSTTPVATSTLDQIAQTIPQVVQTQPTQTQSTNQTVASASAPVQTTVLNNNEWNFVNNYAKKIRTDDPTNCPQVDMSTTTQNIANIDSYLNQNIPSTVNGSYAFPVGENKVTAGEQITINSNYMTPYCTKFVFDVNGELIGNAQSPSTLAFTVPTDSFPGEFFNFGGIGFRVVTSTTQ